MRVPAGYTETELIKVLKRLIARLSPPFVFPSFTLEDIKQEAWIAAIDGLERYDGQRPLENFMAVHIRNRLKNVKRKYYFRLEKPKNSEMVEEWKERNEIKKRLMNPQDIDVVDEEHLHDKNELLDEISYREFIASIKEALHPLFRSDFDRVCAGVMISEERRTALQEELVRHFPGLDIKDE